MWKKASKQFRRELRLWYRKLDGLASGRGGAALSNLNVRGCTRVENPIKGTVEDV